MNCQRKQSTRTERFGCFFFDIGKDDRVCLAACQTGTDYRYLKHIPGVRGGNTIVEGTRIGVHDVVGLIINGNSIDDVVRSFPSLRRSQVYECLAYYEDHRGEIDALIARQMSESA